MPSTTLIRPGRVLEPDDNIAGSQQAFSAVGVCYPKSASPLGWDLVVPFTLTAGQSRRVGIVVATGYTAFSMIMTFSIAANNNVNVFAGYVDPNNPPNELGGLKVNVFNLNATLTAQQVVWGVSTSAFGIGLWHLMSIWIVNSDASLSATVNDVPALYCGTP